MPLRKGEEKNITNARRKQGETVRGLNFFFLNEINKIYFDGISNIIYFWMHEVILLLYCFVYELKIVKLTF